MRTVGCEECSSERLCINFRQRGFLEGALKKNRKLSWKERGAFRNACSFCSMQKDDLLVGKLVIKDQIFLPEFLSTQIWHWSSVVVTDLIALSESERAISVRVNGLATVSVFAVTHVVADAETCNEDLAREAGLHFSNFPQKWNHPSYSCGRCLRQQIAGCVDGKRSLVFIDGRLGIQLPSAVYVQVHFI